jgi:1,4-dihydroxy-2-naphthoate octaprenyltransferase
MEAKVSKPKLLFLETRPQFLLLTPAAFSVGIAAAVYEGYFNALHLILAFTGSLLAHITVNVLNDYFDYVRGTDKLTQRTPFSGGSGLLPEKILKPEDALKLGLVSLIIGLLIGAYFIYKYPLLIFIVALAAFLTVAYTPLLTHIYITEIFPGLGFGPLLIIGAYITQLPTGNVHISPHVIWASIPVGILVTNLLWINEIPDYEADIKTGRKHGVILLGKKAAARAYVLFLVLTYLTIIIPVIFKIMPLYSLIALLTLPLAVKASQGALKNYDQTEKLVPSLGQNVLIVLVTPALLTIGLLLARFL